MGKDWRLVNQEKYLMKAHFVYTTFEPRGVHDHVHCAFCWEKIGVDGIREGYCTDDGWHWVCPQCFQDFKDQFQWVLDD